ncbi:hypothetical protein D3C75_1319450 [compost metagenome]
MLDFEGIGSPETARNTVYVVIDDATPKPMDMTISSVNTGFRRKLRRPNFK